jgi:mRNA interferase RelE/StbE
MKTEFTSRFYQNIDKITHATVKSELSGIIQQVEKAKQLAELKNIKKLKGHSIAYRIRMGNFRIGIFYENNIVELSE